jgi:hypothetical protein
MSNTAHVEQVGAINNPPGCLALELLTSSGALVPVGLMIKRSLPKNLYTKNARNPTLLNGKIWTHVGSGDGKTVPTKTSKTSPNSLQRL